MADHIECIGGVARLCPDPIAELDRMRGLTQPDEFAEWLAAHERGHLHIVALELFAEVCAGGATTRVFGGSVPSLSFFVPHGEDNFEHAREVVRSSVDALCARLGREGVDAGADALLELPVHVELDGDLVARLGDSC